MLEFKIPRSNLGNCRDIYEGDKQVGGCWDDAVPHIDASRPDHRLVFWYFKDLAGYSCDLPTAQATINRLDLGSRGK